MTRFDKIALRDWRQFESVSIDFHDRLTVITGANGAGKTTILNMLSQHFGWSIAFIGTLRIPIGGARKYYSGVLSGMSDSNQMVTVGELNYTNEARASIVVPSEGDTFKVSIDNQQSVYGVYITSHRPVYSYQKVTQIPTQVQASEQMFTQYLSNIRQFYQPNAKIESPSHRLKASLISLATFGYGNPVLDSNIEARNTFEGFSKVLADILPEDLGFRQLVIRMPEVILECDAGDFSLDAASGGVAALIDVAWQVFMQSKITQEFTVVMDEPENHLHPRLQRTVLPGLLKAFPQIQFVVATHNPFVVTSVQDSNIVVLDFVDGRVVSKSLGGASRSASANQVLSDVLGVPFPVPLWVEDEIDKIVASISEGDLTTELLHSIRERLRFVGLEDLFPEVVDRLIPE